jgi:16S rRNA (cytosine967-C5)-methyltransferase
VKPGVAVRVAAARVVGAVTDEGGYSNILIRRRGFEFDRGDRRRFEHLVRVTLRQLPRIDRTLAGVVQRPLAEIDPPVRALLRVATAELIVDARAGHAVVDSAVEAAKAMGARRASGFVNGVLRRIVRVGEPSASDLDETTRAALQLGVPVWLRDRLGDALGGSTQAHAFLTASLRAGGVGYRFRRAAVDGDRDGLTPVIGIAGAGYGDAEVVRELQAGGTVDVLDPASTAVALAVDPQPGERVLDLAAAPGGKTAALWDLMEGRGTVVAADRHALRLRRTRRRLHALGADGVELVVMDATRPALAAGRFDRVLLDAPCTGIGTLRRRPEIKLRLSPDAPDRMAERQSEMIGAALRLVRPGGRLVYSVCTVFAEETVAQVAQLDAAPPTGLPGEIFGKGLLLAPHTTGTDGMFISVIRA